MHDNERMRDQTHERPPLNFPSSGWLAGWHPTDPNEALHGLGNNKDDDDDDDENNNTNISNNINNNRTPTHLLTTSSNCKPASVSADIRCSS